ncbi:MAG: hypothetical protein HZB63_10440 [Deltaproteobacteria bacterium]|nr:hypothetical protein [Deltaproteobacteria bacterium]
MTRRIVFLFLAASLLLPCCKEEGGSSQTGATVTKEVPSAKESPGDIKERETKEPPAPQGDRAAPSHKIRREGPDSAPAVGAEDNSVR